MKKLRTYGLQEGKKEFIKIFNTLCYSRHSWEVWADLITVMACSISNAIDRVDPRYTEREREYAECIKRLGGVEKPSQLFSIIVMSLEVNPDQDFLGSLYMELDFGNHWKGQFFTPYNVSRMMAEMTIGNCQAQIDKAGWMSVCDPCVGGGAMLMAAANSMHRNEVNYQNHVLFVGQDIDRIVGLMAYIQISLLGCPGYIVIGNSLTNPILGSPLIPAEQEGQEFWYTPLYNSPVWQGRRLIQVLCPPKIRVKKVSVEGFYFFFEIRKENYLMSENVKKQFTSGAEKLEYEKKEQINKVDKKYQERYQQQLDVVFGELIKKCNDEPAFDEAVLQEHKNWNRCYQYAGKKAMELNNPTQTEKDSARRGDQPIVVAATSEMVLEWIFDYYMLDDKEQIEKELAEAAKKEAEVKETEAKNAKAMKKAKSTPKSESKPMPITKKKNEMEGQVSLFDMI